MSEEDLTGVAVVRCPSDETMSRAKDRFCVLEHSARHVANEVALEFVRFLRLKEVDSSIDLPPDCPVDRFRLCVETESGLARTEPNVRALHSDNSDTKLASAYSTLFGLPLPYLWNPKVDSSAISNSDSTPTG